MGHDSGRSWVQPVASIGTSAAAAGAAAGGATAGTGMGVAAGVSATAATPAAGFLGISPIGWAIIGVSLIGSFFMRSKKKAPPPEAQGIRLGTPVDANAPWLKVYGEPWFSPPLLTQYAEPARLNSTKASNVDTRQRVTGRAVFVCHCGAGPVSGKGLQAKYGGNYISSQIVTTDSPAAQQDLTHELGSGGTKWRFPAFAGALIENSVQITADGVTIWTGPPGAGSTTEGNDDTTVAATFCAAENFVRSGAFFKGNRDSDIPVGQTRVGCFLPKSGLGVPDAKSVTATIHFGQSSSLVAYTIDGSKRSTSVGAKTFALKAEEFGFEVTDEGKQYFYVRKVTTSGNGSQALAVASASSTGITGFTLAYTIKANTYKVDIDKTVNGYVAVISPALSSTADVKATYSISTTVEDTRLTFRAGTTDQEPIADGEAGTFFGTTSTFNTVIVGLELTAFTARTFTSTAEVDDIRVCIETGPKGFYGMSSDSAYTGMGRGVTMSLKEQSAADTGTTLENLDPSKGWVTLRNPSPDPKYGDFVFRMRDTFQGVGQWFWSVADLFAFTIGKSAGTTSGHWLPPTRYMVKVTAQEAAGVNESGIQNTDRFFSDIFLANATEIRRVGLVLPRQATLTVGVGADSEQDGKIECKFQGASVVQLSSASASIGADGLPAPRTTNYSRNPVWCACDFITDALVGGGRVFSWSDIDLSSAYDAASWCDETVTLRDGTTQTRSQCDVVIGENGERRSLGEWLAVILAGSGVMCFWKGGWKFVVDEDADPVTDPVTSAGFIINEEADCLPATAELSFATAEELPSELVVQFKDAENADAESQEPLYFDDPQPTPRITERVEFPAVRRRKQARHFGGILLRQMRRATRRLRMVGTIGRGLRFLMLEPGDIVYVTSVRLGLSAVKFRVMTAGFTSGMRPALELVEHVPSAYTDDFAGPNSGVTPGLRQPSDTPAPTQLKVTHVTGASLQTVGGAP